MQDVIAAVHPPRWYEWRNSEGRRPAYVAATALTYSGSFTATPSSCSQSGKIPSCEPWNRHLTDGPLSARRNQPVVGDSGQLAVRLGARLWAGAAGSCPLWARPKECASAQADSVTSRLCNSVGATLIAVIRFPPSGRPSAGCRACFVPPIMMVGARAPSKLLRRVRSPGLPVPGLRLPEGFDCMVRFFVVHPEGGTGHSQGVEEFALRCGALNPVGLLPEILRHLPQGAMAPRPRRGRAPAPQLRRPLQNP
jgi:hypothetical protein